MKSDKTTRDSEFSDMEYDINEVKTMFTHMMIQKQHYSPVHM